MSFRSCVLFFFLIMAYLTPAKLLAKDVIAVVDVNEVFQKALVAVDLNSQLRTEQNDLKKKFEKKEQELRDTEKSIESQRGIITDAALKEKIDKFNAIVADTQKEAREKSANIEKAYFATLDNINSRFKEIIAKYSASQEIDIVLHKAQVIYKSDAYPDITSVALKKLNEELPSIKLADIRSIQ